MVNDLEKTIEFLGEVTPMPKLVRLMNGFLANPFVKNSEIIKRVNKGIGKLRRSFAIQGYFHEITDYDGAEKLVKPPYEITEDRPFVRDELPRSKIYVMARELFFYIPDFKFYLEQVSKSSNRELYGANGTVSYFPQGVDFCLIECLQAINKVGLVTMPHYIYEDKFENLAEVLQENIEVPLQNKRLFFFHDDGYSKGDYRYFKDYQKMTGKILKGLGEINKGGRE